MKIYGMKRILTAGTVVSTLLMGGSYTFSLSFEEPVSLDAVQAIVNSIPWT